MLQGQTKLANFYGLVMVHVFPVASCKGHGGIFVQEVPNWVVLHGPDPKDPVVPVDVNRIVIVGLVDKTRPNLFGIIANSVGKQSIDH